MIHLDVLVTEFCSMNNELRQAVNEAEPYLFEFCLVQNMELIGITTLNETGCPEPGYIFNDGLGAYNIEGIKKSLAEWKAN